MLDSYPKVIIEYCSKCKWHNRAFWYLQELLMTFDNGKINEISLKPIIETPGTFKVILGKSDDDWKVIYQKKMKKSTEDQSQPYIYEGFPDSKFLKVLIRNEISPDENLGHLDKHQNYGLNNGESEAAQDKACNQDDSNSCRDCKLQE